MLPQYHRPNLTCDVTFRQFIVHLMTSLQVVGIQWRSSIRGAGHWRVVGMRTRCLFIRDRLQLQGRVKPNDGEGRLHRCGRCGRVFQHQSYCYVEIRALICDKCRGYRTLTIASSNRMATSNGKEQ